MTQTKKDLSRKYKYYKDKNNKLKKQFKKDMNYFRLVCDHVKLLMFVLGVFSGTIMTIILN